MNTDQVNRDHVQIEADEVMANEAYHDAILDAMENKDKMAEVEKKWKEWRGK